MLTWIQRIVIDPVAHYTFMQHALLAAVMVGLTTAVLSCFMVVRRTVMLGDALSHVVVLGVVIGWLVAGYVGVFAGALVVGLIVGTAITYVERHSQVHFDAALGVIFSSTLALGLAIVSVVKPKGIDMAHILLGNILGVDSDALRLVYIGGAIVLTVVAVLFKALRLWSFDPEMARAMGLRTGALQYVFYALLSLTIVTALQTVGLVLVVAMVATPGSIALLLTDRLARMIGIAAVVGMTAGVVGMYASYYANVASGPSIVLVLSLLFVIAFLVAPRRGLLTTAWHRRRTVRIENAPEALHSSPPIAIPSAGKNPRGQRLPG